MGLDAQMVDNELILRVTGLLGHCNTFAAYLSAACSMALILLLARIGTAWKAAILPCLAAGLLALALTFSRNGWLVFVLDALLIAGWAWRTGRMTPASRSPAPAAWRPWRPSWPRPAWWARRSRASSAPAAAASTRAGTSSESHRR